MSEYIDRDKIFSTWRSIPAPASLTSLAEAISKTPAEDVQQVVRCKDCRYSNFDPEYGKRWCDRCLSCMLVKDDDFCSYGNRPHGWPTCNDGGGVV